MSRFRFTIANLMGVVASAAIVSVAFLFDPMLGLALFVAAGIGLAGYLLREDLAYLLDRSLDVLGRPVGRVGLVLLFALGRHGARRAVLRPGHVSRRSGAAISSGTRGSSTGSSATTWPTWRPRGPGIARWPTCSCRTTRTSCRPGGW